MKISKQIKATPATLLSIFEFLKTCQASSEELDSAIEQIDYIIAENKFDNSLNLKFGEYILMFESSSRATLINEIYTAREKLEDYKVVYEK